MKGIRSTVKILIVTKGYYPHGDATGAVVRNVTEALIAQGHSVHVAGLSGEKADTAVMERRGERITNLYVPEMRSRAQLMRDLKKKPLRTGGLMVRRTLAEAERSLLRRYRELSVYPPYARAYRRFFREHLRKETYDLVLITLMPQDAVWAFQREKIRCPWAVYQLDTYWNRGTDTETNLEERKAFERRMAEECAFVLTTPLIAEANGKLWPDLKDKWIPSEFPMVREAGKISGEPVFRDGRTHLVFAGALYPGLRPPEKAVRAIAAWKELVEKEPAGGAGICFDFYGGHQELVEAAPDYPGAKEWIALHGSVSSEEAARARETADFLINIDNTNPLQVPSKIFEYISTGKPVVNFVFDDRSPILPYLRDYPLCLTINLNRMREDGSDAAEKLAAFVQENRGKRLPFARIRECYLNCTPEYVAEQLVSAAGLNRG